MDNFGYEIKTNFQLSNRNVPALLFIPPLEHTARPYARVSGPFFAMRARFSARIPSLRGPRPPAMAQKADASARAKKNERKRLVVDIHLNSQKKNVPPGAKSPCSRRETSKPTKVPRPVRFLRRVSRRRRAFRASRLPACVCEKECCFVCAVRVMIWEMFDKKVFPKKMALPFRVLWFVKRTDSKRTKKGAQTERERERACV